MPTVLPGLPVKPPETGGTTASRPRRVRSGGSVPTSSGRTKKGSFRVVKVTADATIGQRTGTAIIQVGTVSFSLVAASSANTAVTFPRETDSAPTVVASCSSHDGYVATCLSQTTTGFTLHIRHINDTPATTTVAVDWLAI